MLTPRRAAILNRLPLEDWTATESAARHRLCLLVGVATGLLWLDNLTEHYRGSFKLKAMWVPAVIGPFAAVCGIMAGLSTRSFWRRAFLIFSLTQGVLGLVGFWFHQRGILRRPGQGWRMYVFNAWYGPPMLAPLQYFGFSLLGLLGTLPYRWLAPLLRVLSLGRLLRLFVAVNTPPLWVEISYLHWRGSFQNRWQWLPVLMIPLACATNAAAAISPGRLTRRCHLLMTWLMLAGGALGTALHLVGMGRQYQGYSRKTVLFSWLSGPPVLAPLQVIVLGLVNLIGEWANASHKR
jgi:hypothetical protein